MIKPPFTDYRLPRIKVFVFVFVFVFSTANGQPTNEARVEAKFTLIIPSEEEEKPTQ